jgi:cytochrome c oxidase subunit I+III
MSGQRRTLDVSVLPNYAFGHKGLIWWGTAGYMVIEGSMFVIALIVYFYLRLKVSQWPPSRPDPDRLYGTINLLVVFASCVPAALAKRAAERFDRRGVCVWLAVLTLGGIVSVGLRGLEFPALNCRWDDNAYGSITWVVLGLHTIHVATDVFEGAVLLVQMMAGPVTEPRYVDVSENSLYWYFITLWWIPIYLAVYWAPRWL